MNVILKFGHYMLKLKMLRYTGHIVIRKVVGFTLSNKWHKVVI